MFTGALKMKIDLLFCLLCILFILGCSKAPSYRGRWSNFTEEQRLNRFGNLSSEERRQMIEQRQQAAIESCSEKSEGDSCTLENSRGTIEGICKVIEDNLICATEREIPQR
jgi:hypothetical protein